VAAGLGFGLALDGDSICICMNTDTKVSMRPCPYNLGSADDCMSRDRQGLGPTTALAQTPPVRRVKSILLLQQATIMLLSKDNQLPFMDLFASRLRYGKILRVLQHRTHQCAAAAAAETSSSTTSIFHKDSHPLLQDCGYHWLCATQLVHSKSWPYQRFA
jgi:hypothetical protein